MSQASEVIASQVGSAINNQKTWGTIIYNVKDPQYGAKGDGVKDDTSSITKALQAAFSAGGGVVLAPPGIYNVTSQIVIPKGVSLVGCGIKAAPRWVSGSSSWDLTQIGTVFAVKWGSGGSSVTNAAFQMSSRSKVEGCCFWYPNQLGSTTTPAAYPPTMSTVASDTSEAFNYVNSITIRNCLYVNPWIAMDFTIPHQLLTVDDIQGTAWFKFLRINQSYDVDRISNIQLNSNFSYKGNWPSNSNYDYQLNVDQNTTAFEIGKADSMTMVNCFSYGFHRGLWIHNINGFEANGITFIGCGFEGNNVSISIENASRRIKISDTCVGTNLVTNSSISIYINMANVNDVHEIVLTDISSFQSNKQGIYIRNCSQIFMSNVLMYAACLTNPGFSIHAVDIANTNNLTIRDCTLAIGGTNAQATNVILDTCKAFVMNNTMIYGQLSVGAAEVYVNNCTHGRIEKTFIATSSSGSKTVQIVGGSNVTAVDTIVF